MNCRLREEPEGACVIVVWAEGSSKDMSSTVCLDITTAFVLAWKPRPRALDGAFVLGVEASSALWLSLGTSQPEAVESDEPKKAFFLFAATTFLFAATCSGDAMGSRMMYFQEKAACVALPPFEVCPRVQHS